jgi:hypothetical protein
MAKKGFEGGAKGMGEATKGAGSSAGRDLGKEVKESKANVGNRQD